MKPIIGLLSGQRIDNEGVFAGELLNYVCFDYVEAIDKCQGVPLIIPVENNEDNLKQLLELVDGLILTGGSDIDPLLYNENVLYECGLTFREVDAYYMKAIHIADQLHIPMLGICKGHQALNVAYGGTLYQDIKVQKKDSFKHFQDALRYEPTHQVTIEKKSSLYELFGEKIMVNSFHHQAIKDLAEGFKAIAYSDDGMIEAIEKESDTYILGVQWHPEMMIYKYNENMIKLVTMFINKCQK